MLEYCDIDVAAQIANIFAKSNLEQLLNINALFDFPIYTTMIFWVIIALTSWLLLTLVIVLCKVRKYGIVHDFHVRKLKFRKDAVIAI